MMKEIISNIAVITNAQYPGETNKVLFKDFVSIYSADQQVETFSMNSYKVIDDENGVYELIKSHSRTIEKTTLDAIRASMNIVSTDYTDIRNEELVKGAAIIIDTDSMFGLSSADLTIR